MVTTHAPVEIAPDRPGLNVAMGTGAASVVSDEWAMGAWTIQFARLDPHQRLPLDHTRGPVYVKVVTGRLVEVDRGAYAAPRVIRDTQVRAQQLTAGADGALLCIFTATDGADDPVVSIGQLRFHGPLDEALSWQSFEDRYRGATTYFDGLDAHLAPGFHLLDDDGSEIAYVFVWAAGKGVDLSTHDHGRSPGPRSPAFAEVHWVFHNGTGSGGMYETTEPGAPSRDRYPVPPGHEHGPFFAFDADTGTPRLRASGAVDYPWHGWEAGPDDKGTRAYDVVAAFEITVPYARVVV
jgi:hypothetical protein